MHVVGVTRVHLTYMAGTMDPISPEVQKVIDEA